MWDVKLIFISISFLYTESTVFKTCKSVLERPANISCPLLGVIPCLLCTVRNRRDHSTWCIRKGNLICWNYSTVHRAHNRKYRKQEKAFFWSSMVPLDKLHWMILLHHLQEGHHWHQQHITISHIPAGSIAPNICYNISSEYIWLFRNGWEGPCSQLIRDENLRTSWLQLTLNDPLLQTICSIWSLVAAKQMDA